MSPATRASLRAALTVVLPTLLLCVAMLEVGLRLQGRLPSNVTEGIFEQHGAGYRPRKNLTKITRAPSFVYTVHTNEFGLRDARPGPRPLGPGPYVAWLGDSATYANGVDYQDSFVGLLGAQARRHGLDVLNLAVAGHHLSEQEERLEEFLQVAPQKPSHVVVVFTPLFARTFEQRHSRIQVRDGFIYPATGWLLPYVIVTLGNASAAYSFVRDGIRRLQDRYFPAGPEMAAEMLDLFSREGEPASGVVGARFEARLEQLDQRIRRHGATPIYVYLPSSVDTRIPELLVMANRRADGYDLSLYSDRLRRHGERAGVTVVDLFPTLQAEQQRGVSLSFRQDMHFNRSANQVIANALQEALLDGPDAPLRGRR